MLRDERRRRPRLAARPEHLRGEQVSESLVAHAVDFRLALDRLAALISCLLPLATKGVAYKTHLPSLLVGPARASPALPVDFRLALDRLVALESCRLRGDRSRCKLAPDLPGRLPSGLCVARIRSGAACRRS